MVNNTITKTPEEQLKEYEEIKKDYEWLAKSNLEMIYKYEEKLSDEEIEELINGADWKEKTQFGISEGWGTTIGSGSKGISYTTNQTTMHFTKKPIYLIENEVEREQEKFNKIAKEQKEAFEKEIKELKEENEKLEKELLLIKNSEVKLEEENKKLEEQNDDNNQLIAQIEVKK